jgi:hypothetical protein
MKLTLVTGCDAKYFSYLKRALNNIFNTINNNEHNNLDINVVFYNLGLTEDQSNEIRNSYPRLIFEIFNFNEYPEHLSLKNYTDINCSYAWKPVIFYEVCEKYKNLVHWFDTRNLYSNFNNIIKILLEESIYIPASNHIIEKWNHIKTLQYMDGFKYIKEMSRAACVIGINYNIDWCQNIIKEWKHFSLIKECIIPEGTDRNNHRQDQAILEILYFKYHEKYNFKIIDEFIDVSIQTL